MADKMYCATKCTRCSGMVGYRDVKYVLSIGGMRAEEELPVGTMRLRCDHGRTMSGFNLQNLHPTSIKLVVPTLPYWQPRHAGIQERHRWKSLVD
jgi:hypothetical protein